MGNIVLNIPHSSINGIFDEEIGGWYENPFFINGPVRDHTDWYTDIPRNFGHVRKKIALSFSGRIPDSDSGDRCSSHLKATKILRKAF